MAMNVPGTNSERFNSNEIEYDYDNDVLYVPFVKQQDNVVQQFVRVYNLSAPMYGEIFTNIEISPEYTDDIIASQLSSRFAQGALVYDSEYFVIA